MNKSSSKRNIFFAIAFIINILFEAYSIAGTFIDLPNFGEFNNMVGVFIGFLIFVLLIAIYFSGMYNQIYDFESKYPNLIVQTGYETSIKPSEIYGKNSYILQKVPADKRLTLFYLEVKNKPRSEEGKTALGVQCKFYFYKEGYIRYILYGRWVDTPEHVKAGSYKNLDIRPNIDSVKLGMGFIVGHEGDYFYPVDGEELNNGISEITEDMPCLMNGEYVVVAEFSGQNFPPFDKVYEIKNLNFKKFDIKEKKNGEKWWKNTKAKSKKLGFA